MSDGLDKMADIFLEEASDLLEKLEDHLLRLEQYPEDADTIAAVFRTMHTIKGSAGMFGFNAVSRFTHQAENTFDEVRNGRVAVTSDLITLTLNARDHIRNMLSDPESKELVEETEKLISKFQVYLLENAVDGAKVAKPAQKVESTPVSVQKEESSIAQTTVINQNDQVISINTKNAQETAQPQAQAQTPQPVDNDEPEVTYRISFEPDLDVFMNGTKPHSLIGELADMGEISIIPFYSSIPSLKEIDPAKCYMSWNIILTTTKSLDDIQDVFMFLDNSSKIDIKKVADSNQDTQEIKKLGEILIDKDIVTADEISAAIGNQKPLGQILTEKKVVSVEDVQAALAEQKHIKEQREKKLQEQNSQTIKVNSTKLDRLIDLVGELVTFNARLNQLSGGLHSSTLSTLSEQGERLILELRDTTMDMRMLPIGTIFSRFRRLVRDLSSETKKNIELITEGAETELDKTVIEKLNDPLVHLIRNSVDHGVESPEVRLANGKPAQGKVTLKAQHAGAFVLITIEDDGAGLDLEKIRKKAIDRGLISANDELTDAQTADLIFMPGFSTADKVTSISGRGVGMDVVKRDITSLGGSVSISTKRGVGTKFILKIPLTLAIIEGILVQVGDNSYVLPLSNVLECLKFQVTLPENKFCATSKIREDMIPFIDLRNFFGITTERPAQQQIVMVTDQDSKIGIVIDKVIGNYQTVIKPLGKLYHNVQGISGATILGDGSVALILDIYKLSDIVGKIDENN